MRILYLFVSATQGAVLGALITLAPRPWYTVHDAGARAWGVDLLEDQQIAGLVMWVPGGLVYAAAALASFVSWLTLAERATVRRERRRARAARPKRATGPLEVETMKGGNGDAEQSDLIVGTGPESGPGCV
jgi:cytochrome c oxidase assembly factor CtaG